MAVLHLYNAIYITSKHKYLEEEDNPYYQSLLTFFTYFILINTMIPISLIVSLEMVKMA